MPGATIMPPASMTRGIGRKGKGAHRRNGLAFDQKRPGDQLRGLGGFAEPAVDDRGQFHPGTPRAPRVNMSRQAMRTATPISTCSVMAERAGSSASELDDLDAAVHGPRMHDAARPAERPGAARASGRRACETRVREG